MGGDNAPINITRRAITFIYLYSSPEGGTRGGGGGLVEFYLRSIKLINNAPSPLSSRGKINSVVNGGSVNTRVDSNPLGDRID